MSLWKSKKKKKNSKIILNETKLNSPKDTIKKLKKVNPCKKGNICQVSDNGLVSRMYEDFSQLSHQENNLIKNMGKVFE